MLTKIKAAIVSDDPIVTLIKFFVLVVLVIILIIFASNVSTTRDWEWYKTDFEDLPNRLIIYQAGQQTELLPGQPGFDEIAGAVTESLKQGVDTQSNTGLSDQSLADAYDRYTTLEVFFAQPVKLHTWFYTGNPTQMLFPLTGRHSDRPMVFLGTEAEYRINAPVLNTKAPIVKVLKELGYLD